VHCGYQSENWQIVNIIISSVLLDGSLHYHEIIDFLESSLASLDGFMTGRTVLSFVNAQALTGNNIYQALLSPSEYDNLLLLFYK